MLNFGIIQLNKLGFMGSQFNHVLGHTFSLYLSRSYFVFTILVDLVYLIASGDYGCGYLEELYAYGYPNILLLI